MKRRILLTVVYFINIIMMCLPWFINLEGYQVYGTMFHNPVGLMSLIVLFVGIWMKETYGERLMIISWLVIIFMEIYEFLTWHIRIYGGTIDLSLSIALGQREFYLAFFISCISCLLFLFYKQLNQKRIVL